MSGSTRSGAPSREGISRIERVETLVIGGGQAGLAVGQQLATRDADVLILDAEQQVGDVWRRRWDSLRLFTPARYCALPDSVFPAPPDHFPDKDEVADYLGRYAERFDLPIRQGTRVTALRREGNRYVAEAGDLQVECDQVVLAAGPFQRPLIPSLAAELSLDIVTRHSSAYRRPADLPEGPVLVVGAGNSGAQIAMELARDRKVWLAGRNTGHLPRRVAGRDLFDWLWPVMTRATVESRVGRAFRARIGRGGDALLGITERNLHAAGVMRVGRLTHVRGGYPMCDGTLLTPRSIIWCTGFAADYQWIDLPLCDVHGVPQHRRGEALASPGVYFVGLRFQTRLNSSLLGGVGLDARAIASRILERATL